MQESILEFRAKRFLWVAVALCLFSILLYALHQPAQPRNGGTVTGYILGTIGALLIIWLTAFGIRKRKYKSNLGSVEGWLSAHVYLGTSLIVIATLHSGFQLGWNVHSLAYFLMLAVIASGFYGVYVYLRYPSLVTANRRNMTREQMLDEVGDLDRRCKRVAKKSPREIQELVSSAINRTTIGGSILAQLRGRDESSIVLPDSHGGQAQQNTGQSTAIDWLVERQSRCQDPDEAKILQELSDMLGAKQVLLAKLRKDIQLHAFLQIWLFFHVPLTFALIAALLAHIISVFLYW